MKFYSRSNVDELSIENQIVLLKMFISLVVKTTVRGNGYKQEKSCPSSSFNFLLEEKPLTKILLRTHLSLSCVMEKDTKKGRAWGTIQRRQL